MPTPNPIYDPNWQAIHDRHDAERSRLREEMNILRQSDNNHDHEQAEKLQEQWHVAHEACLDSFRMQFPTMEEHAEWVFREFNPERDAGEFEQIDFATLTSFDAINEAWTTANKRATDNKTLARNSIKVGQPDGMVAFSGCDGSKPFSYIREFTGADLSLDLCGRNAVRAVVTVDCLGDQTHVCIGQHRDDRRHFDVEILAMAQCLFREAEGLAQEKRKQDAPGGIADTLSRAFGRQPKPLLNPDNFTFYHHRAPSTGFVREAFAELAIPLRTDHDPGSAHISHDHVPEAIRSASRNRPTEIKPVPLKRIAP